MHLELVRGDPVKRPPLLAALAVSALVTALPALAQARGCTEVSDVTGEKKCSRFGSQWTLEGTFPILFRFGMRYSAITTEDQRFTAPKVKNVKHAVAYGFDGQTLGFKSITGVALDGGFGFFLWGQLYAGAETHLSVGHLDTRAAVVRVPGQTLQLTQDDGLNTVVFGGAIPIGYRIPLGRAALRPEVAFGFESIGITHHVMLPDGRSWTGNANATRGLIEPRIAGEIWFTQHVALAVAGGINLIGGNTDHSLGISLAWHFRAFDGASAF